MNIYSCDFETNNSEMECRVWLYGIWNIYTEQFWYGTKISDFFNTIDELGKHENITLSFHNLKFDGVFLLCDMIKKGYKLVKDTKQKLEKMQYRTLISDMGVWYKIEWVNKYGYKIKVINTLCILPFKLSDISKGFNIEEKKGSIDYDYIRSEWYTPTKEEIEYVKNDCVIAGKALKFCIDNGDDRLTAGANALQNYKNMTGKKNMQHFFLNYHQPRIAL